MKYEKHNARQLFVEKGIERVSFSAVADSCGIARATLYKYFPDKESLLWAIHRQALRTFGNALLARAEARPLTALERFSVYFEELARRFELDPDFLYFSTCLKKPIRRKRRGVARCLRADVPAGRFRLRRHCTIFMREF
ncbi:MAG: TetR/AcrR family transcriptional regulator [Ruthenibacterium lactatiformans]